MDRKSVVRLEMNEKGRKLIRKEKTSGIVGKTTFKFDLWEIAQKKKYSTCGHLEEERR